MTSMSSISHRLLHGSFALYATDFSHSPSAAVFSFILSGFGAATIEPSFVTSPPFVVITRSELFSTPFMKRWLSSLTVCSSIVKNRFSDCSDTVFSCIYVVNCFFEVTMSIVRRPPTNASVITCVPNILINESTTATLSISVASILFRA